MASSIYKGREGAFWQPSTQHAAHTTSLHGTALSRHKDELNDVQLYNKGKLESNKMGGFSPSGSPNYLDSGLRAELARATGSSLLAFGHGVGARGGLSAVPCTSTSQPPGRGLQGLPGRNINHNPGDVYPMASRGIANGGLPKWGFERMPSLLQQPMHRDYVKRGAAGAPPCSLVPPPEAPRHLDPKYAHLRPSLAMQQEDQTPASSRHGSDTSRSNGGDTGRSGMLRMSSQPDMRGPPPRPGGMHGMIGMSWDNARNTSGNTRRGGDGAFLGA